MMDLGSNSKHMSVPMSANFAENTNIGAISKGLNSASNITNNSNSSNNISNLNTSNNLPQASLFRADNQVGAQAGSENNINAKKNPSGNNNNGNINNSSNNNNNNNNNTSSVSKTSSSNGVRYKECLKNHAANMGGYAVDGCGEFMPSGDEGSIEALKCAACGCHRNFHRREINGGNSTTNNMSLLALPSPISANNTSTGNNEYGEGDHPHHHNNVSAGTSGGFGHYNVTSPASHHHAMPGFLPHLHHHHHHQYMHSLMGSKLVQGAHGGHAMLGGHHGAGHPYSGVGGKRFRTKFTMEQREKMFEFSEKVGWRIQKQDEAAVQQFCADAGVKRHVLKVWMHNNKNTFGKKLLRFPEAFNALPESSS